jgi:hypothetical protein
MEGCCLRVGNRRLHRVFHLHYVSFCDLTVLAAPLDEAPTRFDEAIGDGLQLGS